MLSIHSILLALTVLLYELNVAGMRKRRAHTWREWSQLGPKHQGFCSGNVGSDPKSIRKCWPVSRAKAPALQGSGSNSPGLAEGWTGPCLGLDNSRCGAYSTAPSLVRGDATGSRALQGNTDGSGVKEAHLEKEGKAPSCSADQGRALRSPRGGIRVG